MVQTEPPWPILSQVLSPWIVWWGFKSFAISLMHIFPRAVVPVLTQHTCGKVTAVLLKHQHLSWTPTKEILVPKWVWSVSWEFLLTVAISLFYFHCSSTEIHFCQKKKKKRFICMWKFTLGWCSLLVKYTCSKGESYVCWWKDILVCNSVQIKKIVIRMMSLSLLYSQNRHSDRQTFCEAQSFSHWKRRFHKV